MFVCASMWKCSVNSLPRGRADIRPVGWVRLRPDRIVGGSTGSDALALGRDDFNFLSWIVSASSYIVSVTERNSLDSMVLVRVVPHTQHKRYPCDRNFSTEWKNRFLVSCSVNLNRCLPYSLNPPQLPRETLWMGCVRSGIWPTPPTSAHIVTEKDSHWEKTIHMVRSGS